MVGARKEESLRGGEAPFFIKKFPLSLIRRGGQGVRLPIILIGSGAPPAYPKADEKEQDTTQPHQGI